jgi:hypothetical protein
MPLTRIDRGYLFVAHDNLTDRIRVKGLLRWNPFKKIPEIRSYLFLPNINGMFLVSDAPTGVLADKLRQAFPKVVFMISPVHELDGFLPEKAWAAIRSICGPEQ